MEDIYGYGVVSGMMRLNKIRAMHEAGYKTSEIAESIGTSKHNIRAILKSLKKKETVIDR